MSEFSVRVIELPEAAPHPDADRLVLFRLPKQGVTVVGNKESWEGHKKAIYVPVDSTLPDTEHFSFLSSSERKRLKAKKLRGVLSVGLLLPALDTDQVGDEVSERLGVKKYVEPEKIGGSRDDVAKAPSGEIRYTDIESLRKNPDVFSPDDVVVVHEKIDGSNFRFVRQGGEWFVGSHNVWLKEGGNWYWNVFNKYKLGEKVPNELHFDNLVFFGEVFGKGIQIGYQHELDYVIFDVFDIKKGYFYSYTELLGITTVLGLKTPKMHHYGLYPGLDAISQMAEQDSELWGPGSENPLQEGVVVKLVQEGYDEHIGRMILKYHSDRYLEGSPKNKRKAAEAKANES